MASTQIASDFLRQLDMVLQLISASSSSLTTPEIEEMHQALARTCTSLEIILEARNLETEGVTLVCEFGTNPLNTLFTFNKDNPPTTRELALRHSRRRIYNTTGRTTIHRRLVRRYGGNRSSSPVARDPTPTPAPDPTEDGGSPGRFTSPLYTYPFLIRHLEA